MRSWSAVTVAAVAVGWACSAPAPTSSAGSGSASAEAPASPPLPQPLIHHVGLNVVDPARSMEWYQRVWPEGQRAVVDDTPALKSAVRGTTPPQDFFHIFNQVSEPALGGWNVEQYSSAPQSPLWHIGTYEDTTSLRARFEDLGVATPLMWGTPGGTRVWRSGESPYRGMQTANSIRELAQELPRDGGFGYIIGPDGELVEASGGPQARRGFDHVHLFHEAPWCAARWYIDHLGMRPPAQRNPGTAQLVEIEIPEPCEVDVSVATYPALEPYGTIRGPRATVRYGNGSMSAYPRQCREGRCGEDQALVSSEGHVLDHVGFLIPDLDLHATRLRSEGVRIVRDIHPFGTTRALMVAGPDGLLIHLVER